MDINKTNLYMINTWESEMASDKVYEKFKGDVFEQVREMGVKVSILGGQGEVRFYNPELLDSFTDVRT